MRVFNFMASRSLPVQVPNTERFETSAVYTAPSLIPLPEEPVVSPPSNNANKSAADFAKKFDCINCPEQKNCDGSSEGHLRNFGAVNKQSPESIAAQIFIDALDVATQAMIDKARNKSGEKPNNTPPSENKNGKETPPKIDDKSKEVKKELKIDPPLKPKSPEQLSKEKIVAVRSAADQAELARGYKLDGRGGGSGKLKIGPDGNADFIYSYQASPDSPIVEAGVMEKWDNHSNPTSLTRDDFQRTFNEVAAYGYASLKSKDSKGNDTLTIYRLSDDGTLQYKTHHLPKERPPELKIPAATAPAISGNEDENSGKVLNPELSGSNLKTESQKEALTATAAEVVEKEEGKPEKTEKIIEEPDLEIVKTVFTESVESEIQSISLNTAVDKENNSIDQQDINLVAVSEPETILTAPQTPESEHLEYSVEEYIASELNTPSFEMSGLGILGKVEVVTEEIPTAVENETIINTSILETFESEPAAIIEELSAEEPSQEITEEVIQEQVESETILDLDFIIEDSKDSDYTLQSSAQPVATSASTSSTSKVTKVSTLSTDSGELFADQSPIRPEPVPGPQPEPPPNDIATLQEISGITLVIEKPEVIDSVAKVLELEESGLVMDTSEDLVVESQINLAIEQSPVISQTESEQIETTPTEVITAQDHTEVISLASRSETEEIVLALDSQETPQLVASNVKNIPYARTEIQENTQSLVTAEAEVISILRSLKTPLTIESRQLETLNFTSSTEDQTREDSSPTETEAAQKNNNPVISLEAWRGLSNTGSSSAIQDPNEEITTGSTKELPFPNLVQTEAVTYAQAA
jgi:hypothetical protein